MGENISFLKTLESESQETPGLPVPQPSPEVLQPLAHIISNSGKL